MAPRGFQRSWTGLWFRPGSLGSGFFYTTKFADYVLEHSKNTQIVDYIKNNNGGKDFQSGKIVNAGIPTNFGIYYQYEYIQDLINVATPLINNLGTTQSVEALENEYTEKINSYLTAITNKINEVHSLLDSKVVEYDAIKTLITDTKRKVYEAKTIEVIEQLVNEFNLEYQTLYNEVQNANKEPVKSRCNNSTNVVITFVSLLSVFVIAIAIKKHAIR